MKYKLRKLMFIFTLFLFLGYPMQTLANVQKLNHPVQQLNLPAVELKTAMQRLWIDHAIWTRSYIVSALSNLENEDVVLARLLRNQTDIGNALKPYYGEEAGNQLTTLLKEHILIAGKVVEAAEAKNEEEFQKHNTEWYKNADDITDFLISLNPNWNEKEIRELLYVHLQCLTDQVSAMLNKTYDKEIEAFDYGVDHIVMLADALTLGIVQQFPKQFEVKGRKG